MLTQQSVYIPLGNFSPWGWQTKEAYMSLGLVGGGQGSRRILAAPGRGWYTKHTDVKIVISVFSHLHFTCILRMILMPLHQLQHM